MVEREGMYRRDGVIYKVQWAVHGSGNLYAKELVRREYEVEDVTEDGVVGIKTQIDTEWVYAQGVVRKLQPSDMMTLEQAKEYGALYGVCCVCGALLTDEKSITAGIGPVCAKKGGFAVAPVSLYQDDVEYEAIKAEYDGTPIPTPASELPARSISTGIGPYGDVFQLRWDYNDNDFMLIKEAVRGFDWKLMHQKWNPDAKCWSVSATPNAVPELLAFAGRFNFQLDDGAIAFVRNLRPDFEAEAMVVHDQTKHVARSFRELAALA